MNDEAKPLHVGWAIAGPPIVTMLAVVAKATLLRVDKPAIVVLGVVGLLGWLHFGIQPRNRWWAAAASIPIIVASYQLLYRVVLTSVPWPWDGITSFGAAVWAGIAVYVTVTRRPAIVLRPQRVRAGSDYVPGQAYDVSAGFNRLDFLLIPGAVVFVVAGVLLFQDQPIAGCLSACFGGAYVLLRLATLMQRRSLVRIDEQGVHLGRYPLRAASSPTQVLVPWSDVESVVMFKQRAGTATVPYVGVKRRPGCAPPPTYGRFARMGQAFVPHVPMDILAMSRSVQDGRFRASSLEAAVRQFAPAVPVVDLG